MPGLKSLESFSLIIPQTLASTKEADALYLSISKLQTLKALKLDLAMMIFMTSNVVDCINELAQLEQIDIIFRDKVNSA